MIITLEAALCKYIEEQLLLKILNNLQESTELQNLNKVTACKSSKNL